MFHVVMTRQSAESAIPKKSICARTEKGTFDLAVLEAGYLAHHHALDCAVPRPEQVLPGVFRIFTSGSNTVTYSVEKD